MPCGASGRSIRRAAIISRTVAADSSASPAAKVRWRSSAAKGHGSVGREGGEWGKDGIGGAGGKAGNGGEGRNGHPLPLRSWTAKRTKAGARGPDKRRPREDAPLPRPKPSRGGGVLYPSPCRHAGAVQHEAGQRFAEAGVQQRHHVRPIGLRWRAPGRSRRPRPSSASRRSGGTAPRPAWRRPVAAPSRYGSRSALARRNRLNCGSISTTSAPASRASIDALLQCRHHTVRTACRAPPRPFRSARARAGSAVPASAALSNGSMSSAVMPRPPRRVRANATLGRAACSASTMRIGEGGIAVRAELVADRRRRTDGEDVHRSAGRDRRGDAGPAAPPAW